MADTTSPLESDREAALLARIKSSSDLDERRRALKDLEGVMGDVRLRIITEPDEADFYVQDLLDRLRAADNLPGAPLDEKWQRRRDALEMSLTNYLAQALGETGDWAGAAVTYERCLELGKRFQVPEFQADSLVKLGRAYRHANNYSQALHAFEQATAVAHDHQLFSLEAEAIYQQAVVAELQKRQERALNLYLLGLDLSESQRFYPLSIRFLSQLGQLQQSRGEYLPALDYYRRCLRLLRETDNDRESEVIILGQMSHICAEISSFKEGTQVSEEGLKLSRETGQKAEEEAFLYDLARLYRVQGNLALARRYAEESRDRAHRRGDHQSQEAAEHLLERIEANEYEQETTGSMTLDMMLDSLEFGQEAAETYYKRGNRYYQKGAIERAISAYSRALVLNPDHIAAYINRGSAYTCQGHYDRALADYTRALELDPHDAVTFFNRGNAYRKRREYRKALADYTRAIQLDPHDPDAYFNRGEVLRRMKRLDEAAADFRQVLALSEERDPQGAAQARQLLAEIGGL